MAKAPQRITDPTHFRRIKKRLTDAGLELPEYATAAVYWSGRQVQWTNGAHLEDVAKVLTQHVDLAKVPLTLVRRCEPEHSYSYLLETLHGSELGMFNPSSDPLERIGQARAVVAHQGSACVRLVMVDPKAALARARAVLEVARGLLPADDAAAVAALARLAQGGRGSEESRALVRAMVGLAGLDATSLTHAELAEAWGESAGGSCSAQLGADVRCPSCEPHLTQDVLDALNPTGWEDVSPLYTRVIAQETQRIRNNLRNQVSRVERMRSGRAPYQDVAGMSSVEQQAVLALAEGTTDRNGQSLRRQGVLARRPKKEGTPEVAHVARLLAETKRRNPGRTRFGVRCSAEVLKGALTPEELSVFDAVEVRRTRGETDEVSVLGHNDQVLAAGHLPPPDLTAPQGAIYSQLRSDGVSSAQAKEMALLV